MTMATSQSLPMLIALLILALGFGFLNGLHDSANIVAAVITSRALNPRSALLLTALAEFAGPFLFGVAVAQTVGADLLRPTSLQVDVVVAALVAAVAWDLLTWYLGLPTSSSHALIGGLLGAGILADGLGVVQLPGLAKILLALFLSPPIGLVVGYLVMRLTMWVVRDADPSVNRRFRSLQVATLVGLGLSHGTNDGQKTMAVMALGLVASGLTSTFTVPVWVIASSGLAIAVGTAVGGWPLIRTLGGKIFRIRPVHGFSSQVAGIAVILGAALLGGPVSTTQVLSSAIMGTGAAQRVSQVRWMVLRDLGIAWALTIPATGLAAALIYALLVRVTP
jgi:PiT family inorganic phosphate transporter